MRHLRSILYAIVLAPAVWVLCGVGFTHDLVGRARDGGGSVETLTGLLLLLLAGAAYAILVFAPISPAGPLLAGVVFLGAGVWALVSPSTYADLWPPGVSKEGFNLSLPGYGLAALLAVPLICTALSARRWERYEPPQLPLIGTIGKPHGVARPAGISIAVLETAVMNTAETQDTTVVVIDADKTPTVRAAVPDEPTVVASTVPPAPPSPAPPSPAPPSPPSPPMPPTPAPPSSADEPTVGMVPDDEPVTEFVDQPTADQRTTDRPAADQPAAEQPAAADGSDEHPAAFAVSSSGEVTTTSVPVAATSVPVAAASESAAVGESTEATAADSTTEQVLATHELTEPVHATEEVTEAAPATAETTERAATTEEITEPAVTTDEITELAVTTDEAIEPAVTTDAATESAPATEEITKPAPATEEITEPVAADETTEAVDAASSAADEDETDEDETVEAVAASDGEATRAGAATDEDEADKTQVIKLPLDELSTDDLRRIPGERPTYNLDDGGRTQVIGPGERTQVIRRDRGEETQVIQLPGQRTPAGARAQRPPTPERAPAPPDPSSDGERTQVIRLGTGTVEPPGDRTQVLKLPTTTGEHPTERRVAPSVSRSERPNPGEDPTTRLVPPGHPDAGHPDPGEETTVDIGDTKKRIMTVMNLERPADEVADDTRRLVTPPPPRQRRPRDDDA